MTKEVIVIGTGYAGIIAAKKLAKQGLKVTVISPFDSSFATPIVPRLLTQPQFIEKFGGEPFTKIFKGLEIEHIKALVNELDVDKQTVVLNTGETLSYKYLVISSGTKTSNKILKPDPTSSINATMQLILDTSDKIKNSNKIAVIGGGPSGVEIVGDIGDFFPGKDITFFTGSKHPLTMLPENKQLKAEQMLTQKGIKIVNDKLVKSTETEVDGEKFDLVISAVGVKPNNSFIPKKLLDSKGYLKVDKFLKIPEYPNILGFGDIVDVSNNTIVDILMAQLGVFENSVQAYFKGEQVPKQKEHKPVATSLLVPTGKNGGVGLLFGWSVPSFFIWYLKCRDYMMGHLENYFDKY